MRNEFLIIFMVLTITLVLWFSDIDTRGIKYKGESVFGEEDELITKCRQSYETCKDISESKYDITISLLRVEKFEDVDKAIEFYNTWKNPLQLLGLESEIKLSSSEFMEPIEIGDYFPLVLFAVKVKGPGGTLPAVLICSKEGELIKSSKSNLGCG